MYIQIGDRALGLENSSVIVNATEVEVTWAAGTSIDDDRPTAAVDASAGLAKYKTGPVGVWMELEPGAVLYAFHM